MCGIVGLVYEDGRPVDAAAINQMNASLTHRGPDGRGVKLFGHVGLGHTRLKIIDLSEDAAQPMANEDRTVWVTFNGEIYNFKTLRQQLEGRGHRFRSRSDTEVIVHQYEEAGVEGLSALDGMFAFALWDERRQRLVLGRDRTGKKPLFCYHHRGVFAFASEIKALLTLPEVDDSLREASLAAYLQHGYVPTPHTVYRHIQKLPPASFMVFDRGSRAPVTNTFWRFSTDIERPPVEVAAREVRKRLIDAVERRLVADVPLGVYLSGGVDSTLVAAVMRRELDVPVRSFSLGFDGDPAYDESEQARQVARELGTQHTEFRVQPTDLELFEQLVDHYEEPFADVSSVPTFILNRLARKDVTVALTGDGGDEVFAGYPRFRNVSWAESVPENAREALGFLAMAAGEIGPHASPLERGRRAAVRLAEPLRDRLEGWVSWFRPRELAELWRGPLPSHPIGLIDEVWSQRARQDTLNDLLIHNARSYLLDDLNPKMDRASMAVGLETRAPFLDTRLMDYAFRLPGDYKLRRGSTKWILKEAFSDLLPEAVRKRPKMGFGPPVGTWFRGGAQTYVEARLKNPDARIFEFVEPRYVQKMFDAHARGHRDWGLPLWSLLVLEIWLERMRPRRA